VKQALAWQIDREMKAGELSKTVMARRMATSRAQSRNFVGVADFFEEPEFN
jgi:hypothetical protein